MRFSVSSDLRRICFVQLAFALLLNFPVLSGKVPLPVQLVNTFPPWQNVPDAVVERIPFRDLGDAVVQFYPWHVFAGDMLSNGKLPSWNPLILGGTPFIANMQSAIFYPLTWFFAILSGAAAWSLTLILRTVLAGVFMALLLRQ